jgi:hypothetical protein
MSSVFYPSDLSDAEWSILLPLLPPAKPGGRPRTSDLRLILDAIFYVLRSGCPWRLLPCDFPPWPTYMTIFENGTWLVPGNSSTPPYVNKYAPAGGASPRPAERSSIANRSRPPSAAGRMATMGARRSTAASGTCWSIRSDSCSEWSCIPPVCKIATEPTWYLVTWDRCSRGCSRSGPIKATRVRSCRHWQAEQGWSLAIVRRSPRRGFLVTPEGRFVHVVLPATFEPLPKRWIVERTIAWTLAQ